MKKAIAFILALLVLAPTLSCSGPAGLLAPSKAEMSSQEVTGPLREEAKPVASAPGGRILFAKNGAIWEWSDGSTKRLTEEVGAMDPAASPDGTKIAYTRKGNGWSNIHVMDRDSGNDQALTDNKSTSPENSWEYAYNCVWAFAPAWSPSGDEIAYLTEPNSYDLTLWLMNPDGTGARRISWLQDFSGGQQHPSWSADGKEIVTAYWTGMTSNLWILTLETGGWRQLTATEEGAYDAAWSPDGRLIAYAIRNGKKSDVWLVTPDGKGMVQITKTGAARSPAWSPDGKYLAFIAGDGASFDLWEVSVGLSEQGELTAGDFRQLTKGEHLDAAGGLFWSK